MKKLFLGLLITGLLAGTVAADRNNRCDQPPIKPSCSSYEDLSCQSEWADYYMLLENYLSCSNGGRIQKGLLVER